MLLLQKAFGGISFEFREAMKLFKTTEKGSGSVALAPQNRFLFQVLTH